MPPIGDELAALEERVNLRLAAELAAIRTEIAETRGELRAEIANLRASFEDQLRVQTWRLITAMISLTAVVFALARFT